MSQTFGALQAANRVRFAAVEAKRNIRVDLLQLVDALQYERADLLVLRDLRLVQAG